MTTPNKKLDDYQVESKDFLLSSKFRCLFDEPGVGKTGPAIMAAHQLMDLGQTTLITAPAYLLQNWEKEIHDFLPNATVVRADGTGAKARSEALAAGADFVLTSYNNWSAKTKGQYTYPELADKPWAAYIFDEGHRLRGRNSSWTKHVFRTRLQNSPNRETPIWVLTGTPFVRDGGDFFPYFNLYDKKRYGSYWKFVNERCVVTETPWSKNVGNIRKAYASEFRQELAEFSLRRTVKEIPQLATLDFVEHDYQVDMPPSVVAMIKKAKAEYVLEHPDLASSQFLDGSGALYVAQRKIATVPPTAVKPKIDWLKDFIQDRKGKLVVYTWFKDSARAVVEALGDNREVFLATGSISPARRSQVVDSWKGSKEGILVATIPALKEGISLIEASELVFLEHSELPADQEQVIKRLCRRGQEKLVQVHHVHANKTVDMAIKRVLENRNLGIQEALKRWIAEEDAEGDWFN